MTAIEKKPIKTKGGPRPNSGRKKGSPNKVTAEVRALAQQYGEKAISMLAELMVNGQTESGRIAAAKEILDRAYGKATQLIEGPGENGEHLISAKSNIDLSGLTNDQLKAIASIKINN